MCFTSPSWAFGAPYQEVYMTHVRGYRRKNGTYVRPHYRRNPSPQMWSGGAGLGLGVIPLIIFVLFVIAIINHAS